jgi:hypothetical protein
MPAGAIIGAVAGIGGSLISSSSNSKAIDKSSQASLQANRESIAAQKEALDKQLAFQQNALTQGLTLSRDQYNSSGKLQTDFYNQNVGRLDPWTQTGYAATNQLNALIGLPQQQGFTSTPVQFTPLTAPTPPATTPTPTGTIGPPPQPANALMGNPVPSTIAGALLAANGRR